MLWGEGRVVVGQRVLRRTTNQNLAGGAGSILGGEFDNNFELMWLINTYQPIN